MIRPVRVNRWRFFLLALLLCPIHLRAQKPELAGIAHVAFRVTDVDASRKFYSKLGFEQAFEFSRQAKPTQAFIKINDTQFIELYAQTERSQQIGLMHICYESDDLARLHSLYRMAGLHPTPVKKAAAGNLLFTLQGPEGQNLEFTQYMPGSKHFADRGQHLGINRISEKMQGSSLIVKNMQAAEDFYVHLLGFTSSIHGNSVRLILPGRSREQVVLEPENRYTKPQLFFLVPDVRHTEQELRKRGFNLHTMHGDVAVVAPDGISIVFQQAPSQSAIRKHPLQTIQESRF